MRFFEKYPKFKQTQKSRFLSYNIDQVVKKHLLDRENTLARILGARAHLRARCAPKQLSQKMVIFVDFWDITPILARAQNARQRILPIQEMLFDYLIAIVAQKLIELAFGEISPFLVKNSLFWPDPLKIDCIL